jgi:hypothetical protein
MTRKSLLAPGLLGAALGCVPLLAPPALAGGLSANGVAAARYYTSTRDLDEREFALGLSAEPQVRYAADPFLAYADLRGYLERPWRHDQDFVRELYADLSLDWFALRAGKQIVKWGRADEINPTDNLAIFDYTLLTTDRDAMRTGAYALKADAYWKDVAFEGVAVPLFTPCRLPMGRDLPVIDEPPGFAWGHASGAFKVDYHGAPLDGSLSYFYGYLPRPYVSLGRSVDFRYYRAWVMGGDFGKVIGQWGLRGEGAWTMPDEGPSGYRPSFSYVLGIDRTFWQDYYANAQFIEGIVPDYRDPVYLPFPGYKEAMDIERALNNQAHSVTNALSLRLSYQRPDGKWKAGATGIYNLTDGDFLIRPKAEYAFSDHWRGRLGYEYNHGKDASFFGQNRKNNAGFVEAEFLF